MRHVGFYSFAVIALLSLSSFQVAIAQPQPGVGPTRSPSFSPYLNLLRNNGGGGSAVTNYYGIIRPQQQLQQQSGMLQQQLSTQNQSIQGLSNSSGDNTVGPITGNGASFGFYSHYFNNFSAGGSGGGNRSGGGFGSSGGRSGGMGMNGIGGGNIGQGPRQNFGNAAGGGRGRR